MTDYSKVDRALAEGRYWRAKEILQGRLRSAGYDSALYERYGCVLLQLGDLAEAGRYLFLSGGRHPAYGEPIAIYLGRYGKSIRTLWDTFPACVRRSPVEGWPANLLSDLHAAGFSMSDIRKNSNKSSTENSPSWELYVGLGFAILFALLLVGVVVQGFRGLLWLLERFLGP